MDCHIHPGIAAITQCRACHRGVCTGCVEPKQAPTLGWPLDPLRRFLVGVERARWMGGSKDWLYCRPDCDAFRTQLAAAVRAFGVWSWIVRIQLGAAAVGLGFGLLILLLGLVALAIGVAR